MSTRTICCWARFASAAKSIPCSRVSCGLLAQPGHRLLEHVGGADALHEALQQVKSAQVESDGKLSVIRRDWAEPLKRGDLSHT